MAVNAGRFGPSPYRHFNAVNRSDPTPARRALRPIPDHLVGRPARIPSDELSLQRRKSGRRWLGARMVRMQAMEDMRPRESRVQKRREQNFDARSPAVDEMKGYIPQLNASGPSTCWLWAPLRRSLRCGRPCADVRVCAAM